MIEKEAKAIQALKVESKDVLNLSSINKDEKHAASSRVMGAKEMSDAINKNKKKFG